MEREGGSKTASFMLPLPGACITFEGYAFCSSPFLMGVLCRPDTAGYLTISRKLHIICMNDLRETKHSQSVNCEKYSKSYFIGKKGNE